MSPSGRSRRGFFVLQNFTFNIFQNLFSIYSLVFDLKSHVSPSGRPRRDFFVLQNCTFNLFQNLFSIYLLVLDLKSPVSLSGRSRRGFSVLQNCTLYIFQFCTTEGGAEGALSERQREALPRPEGGAKRRPDRPPVRRCAPTY